MTHEWFWLIKLIRPCVGVYSRVVGKALHLNFEPGDDGVILQVTNPRAETVIVEDIRAKPSLIAFSTGHEVGQLVRAIVAQQNVPGESALVIVQPGKGVSLTLIKFDPFDSTPPGAVIKVTLRWRSSIRGAFSQSSVSRKITVRDIRDLQKGSRPKSTAVTIVG